MPQRTVQSEDGSIEIKPAVPAFMGGKGDGPNPEQLFAGALDTAAPRASGSCSFRALVVYRGRTDSGDRVLRIASKTSAKAQARRKTHSPVTAARPSV